MHKNRIAALFFLVVVFASLNAAEATGDREGEGDFKIGPAYADSPDVKAKEGVPAGIIKEFEMDSADSKIYPGLKGPYKRKVAVYVPKHYVEGTEAPFIVAHDGLGYKGTLPKALDNLIAQKKVPVMIAVMVNSGGGDGKGSERGLEYDTVSDKFASFIETEVLPRAAKECNVKFTSNPDGRATMGGSSGGSCAFTMGWFRPDLYHRILTYSGTYVNQQSPTNPESPHGAWEYAENLIPKNPPKPLRIWLEVGEKDNGWQRAETDMHNWVSANVRMAAALKEKGYHYRYEFALGAGHTDGRVLRQTLPEALEWLWRGYK
ncbi:MAG TPA: alpha/beta hydrolase-fold protein [Planctomycetota bacterium]|nr:alpha/beta hydrolase-fold protein [Planctomycetota bacterium]